MMFIRSKLDSSSVVWHNSLTEKDVNSLERIQKASVKIILKNSYKDYESALEMLNLDTLNERRRKQCLKFAKDCLKHKQMKEMFPINERNNQIQTRHNEKFKMTKANTERYRQSAIPFFQRLLNEEEHMKFNEKKRYI